MRWLAVLVVVGLAARAAAQPASATKVVADKEFAEGQAKYVAGDFQGAAEKFKVAYELVSDPVYLFNIAQAYRLAKLCAQAADYYQQFIQASPDPASRDKAARFRDEMTECAKSSALAPQIPPPPSPPAAPPPHSEPAAPTPVAETPSVDDRGHALRVAGLSAGAVGVVALGVAVVYSVKLHDVDRYLDGCHAHPGSCQYSDFNDANRNRGPTDSHVAIASYVVGGAALVGGGVLYWLGLHRASEHAIAVVPTRGGALVTLTFR